MTEPSLSLPTRISLAFGSFFSILGDAGFARRVQRLADGVDVERPAPTPVAPAPPPAPTAASPDAALQLLALLQREARFVDFIEEDVAAHSDADIGAAARLVHDGCRKVLHQHFTLAPARPEAEGSRIVLNQGFDAAAVRLTGNVTGAAPYRGTLSHRGWRVIETRLPRLSAGHDTSIVAAAEVEL